MMRLPVECTQSELRPAAGAAFATSMLFLWRDLLRHADTQALPGRWALHDQLSKLSLLIVPGPAALNGTAILRQSCESLRTAWADTLQDPSPCGGCMCLISYWKQLHVDARSIKEVRIRVELIR